MAVLPYLVHLFFGYYDYAGAWLLLGAVLFHVSLAGAFFRVGTAPKHRPRKYDKLLKDHSQNHSQQESQRDSLISVQYSANKFHADDSRKKSVVESDVVSIK